MCDSELDSIHAIIGRGQIPTIAGKINMMTLRPAMRDQRIDQPAIGGGDVAVEEGPDMVSAGALPLFDQQQPNLRAQGGKGKRDQPPGKAPADNRKIAFQISHSPC